MPDSRFVEFRCLRVKQPMGDFFIGAMNAEDLCGITKRDFRRLNTEDTYLGIQRKVDSVRVNEIRNYVSTQDARFPTAVILAVSGVCAEYREETGSLRLSP